MENQTTETNELLLDEPRKVPETLNVLTILTFIGSGLGILGAFYNFYNTSSSRLEAQMDKIREAQDKLGDSSMGKMMDGSLQMLQRSHDYRYILLATGLIFTALCVVGAMQMRKLKKSGFTIYTIGELAPFVITVVLLGLNLSSAIGMAVMLIIAVIFVILYANQRKHLIYD